MATKPKATGAEKPVDLVAVWPIQHDGNRYESGSELQATAADAEALLASGAAQIRADAAASAEEPAAQPATEEPAQ